MTDNPQKSDTGSVPAWREAVQKFRYATWLTPVRWKHYTDKRKKLKSDRKEFREFITTVTPRSKRTTEPIQLSELKIGAILDPFSYACFEPECTLISFTPDNWADVLEQHAIDFLLVESAWEGNEGAWAYRIEHLSFPPDEQLNLLLEYCRVKCIPTVFWNKEDPSSFDRFIKTAAKFDFIFTTDDNCVEKYELYCKHDCVDPLPFAAQPKIHHPDPNTVHNGKVCFAGTYYADTFDRRKRDMDMLLKGASGFDLDIFDRKFGYEGEDKEKYLFPEEYQPFIRGSLTYDEMLKAYTEYAVFLNVNSVYESPTMFARRVFELLACGTPVISTESAGITKLLGDAVIQVKSSEEVHAALERILGDEEYRSALSEKGKRVVLQQHTYGHRLAEICDAIDIPILHR
jgi:spore maturation protein CgeB